MRKAQTNERARVIQRLEKVLQQAGIKLTSVASGPYSKSARAMLEALLSGVSDPEQLAQLAKARMRQKIPQLREALASRFEIEHHGVLAAQLLAHIDTLDQAIANLDEKIAAMLAPHERVVELLCTIPGVAVRTAQVLIAECGLDMSRWPTVGHFASWAGICPGNRQSARRQRSGHTRPGPHWLREALTESAKAAARTKGTYLAAHHAQLRGRRGEAKATGATRHDILVAYTTSSATRSRSASWDPTGSAAATRPSAAPNASSNSSRRSATRSSSNSTRRPRRPPDHPTPPEPVYRRRVPGANAAAQTSVAATGIHRSVFVLRNVVGVGQRPARRAASAREFSARCATQHAQTWWQSQVPHTAATRTSGRHHPLARPV